MLLTVLILSASAAVALLLRDSIRHDRERRARYGRPLLMNDGFGPHGEATKGPTS